MNTCVSEIECLCVRVYIVRMHYVLTHSLARTFTPRETMGVPASRDGHVSTLEKAVLRFPDVHSYRSARTVGGDDPRLRPKVEDDHVELRKRSGEMRAISRPYRLMHCVIAVDT